MTIEKLKATDVVSSGLTCNTKAGEAAQATGVYHVQCHDKDGNLKWSAESKNLVVSAGLQSKDPSRGHFYVSLVKSALRVVAGAMFIQGSMILGGAFLIAAEVLGIVEELV